MNKQTLFRFIHQTASPEEQEQVLLWLNESDVNVKYFNQLKNLFVVESMPETRATEQEFDSFCKSYDIRQKRNNKPKSIFVVGLTAIVAATVAVFLTLYISQSPILPIDQQDGFVEYTTNRGVKGLVDLPDGSKVWLNSDSYIKFPSRFDGKYREVEFIGEAYFSVAKNADFPMLISTRNDVQIEVRGTNFNLSCYPNDDAIRATLYSGEIIVHSKDIETGAKNTTNVGLFETVSIGNHRPRIKDKKIDNMLRIERNSDTTKCTAWKRGELIFEEAPLDEVIKKLERWHGVDFIVNGNDVYDNTLTARFKAESIQQIMEMLKICCPIDFSIDKNVVVLTASKPKSDP